MSAKNKITFSEGQVVFERADGYTISCNPTAVYVVYHNNTATFKLIPIPKESGLAIMSSMVDDLEVDGTTYRNMEDLEEALTDKFAHASGGGGGVQFEVVEELPESGYSNVIYLVPSSSIQGAYDEYIWLSEQEQWELLGSTELDLDGYLTEEVFSAYSASTLIEIQSISGDVDNKQDVLVSGTNIKTINNESLLGSGNITITSQTITIDSELSSASTNAVANSAITAALSGKCDVDGNLSPIASRSRETNYWQIHKVNGGTFIDSGWININGQPVITNGFDEWSVGRIINLELATEADFSAHTANTDVHVTSGDKATWNAKVDVSTMNAAIDAAMSGASSAYFVDFNGIFNEEVEVDEELWNEMVAAFEDGKLFYNQDENKTISQPLSVQVVYDVSEEAVSIYLTNNYGGGYDFLSITKALDEEEGEYVYVIDKSSYSAVYSVPFNYIYNEEEMDEETFDAIINAIYNESALIDITEGYGGSVKGVVLDDDNIYLEYQTYEGAKSVTITRDFDQGVHFYFDKKSTTYLVASSVDTQLDSGSTNPIANSAVYNAIASVSGGGASQEDIQVLSGKIDTNEEIVATSLNELNGRIVLVSGATSGISSLASDVATISGDVSTISGDVSTISGSVSTIIGDVADIETAMGGVKIVLISQSDYDNLSEYDSNTLYIINE